MACITDVNSLAIDSCPNLKGIKPFFYVIDKGNVTTIGAAVNEVVATITRASGKFWAKFEALKVERDFKIDHNEDGTRTISATLLIPRAAADKQVELKKFDGVTPTWLVVFTYTNGDKRLIGALDDACIIRVSEETANQNVYRVTITLPESAIMPYFTTDTLATS